MKKRRVLKTFACILSLVLIFSMTFCTFADTNEAADPEATETVSEVPAAEGQNETVVPTETEVPAETEAPAETEVPAETTESSESPAETPAETESPAPSETPSAKEDDFALIEEPSSEETSKPEAAASGEETGSDSETPITTGSYDEDTMTYTDGTLELKCTELSDGTFSVEIVKGEGDVTIPEKINGKTVSAVAGPLAAEPAEKITSITWPKTITAIEGNLFDWNLLKEADAKKDLGMNEDWSSTLQIPDTAAVLAGIPKLISSHYEVGAYYAGKCLVKVDPTAKGTFTVKNGTVRILAGAFEGCEKVTGVDIPDSVEYIGVRAFANSGIKKIELPKNVKTDSAEKEDELFASATIGAFTFFGCKDLKTVEAKSEKIESIGTMAFAQCPSLSKVTLAKPEALKNVYDLAFQNCGFEELVLVKNTKFEAGAFMTNKKLKTLVVEDGVKELAPYLFEGADALEKVSLPASLEEIGAAVFKNAGSKATIYLDTKVKTIGAEAFGVSKDAAAKDRFTVILAGDPEIYHPSSSSESETALSDALDKRSVSVIYTNQGSNFQAYLDSKPQNLPEVKSSLPKAATISVSKESIIAGAIFTTADLTVTIGDKKLSPDDFTIDFDASDLTPGKRKVTLKLKDSSLSEVLASSKIKADNFYPSQKEGPVFEIKEGNELSFELDVLAPTYSFTSGKDQTWLKGSSSPLEFTVERNENDDITFDNFTGILIDDEEVDDSNYTAEKGSVKLSLKAAYLQGLDTGDHTLTVQMTDGEAETDFGISEETTEPTEYLTLTVKKVWSDSNNASKRRPSQITVTLYADGKLTNRSLTLNEDNEWKGEFTRIPKIYRGVEMTYTVKESTVTGYTARYTGDAESGFTITNVLNRTTTTTTPTRSSTYRSSTTTSASRTAASKTGDANNTGAWVAVFIVAAAVLALALIVGKRKKS